MSGDRLPPEGKDKPSADAFGRGLGPGLGINLLVSDIARSLAFQTEVLGADVVYWDRDFAILTAFGSVWMLHHDRTYHANPLGGAVAGLAGRGAGAELRLYGRDPDLAEAATEAAGGIVLAPAADKPHGLREAFLLDPDGYLWVPSLPKRDGGK